MTGTSSDVAFADAYVKGVKFDAEAAYDAAVKNATVAPPSSGVGRKGMETSVFTGYANTATHEGLSWSLEGYLNDYGIARMGEELYKKTKKARYKEESAYFLNRAQKYVKLFDEKAGFFQGKKPNGDWRLPSDQYDPASGATTTPRPTAGATPSPPRRTAGVWPTCTAAAPGSARSWTRTSRRRRRRARSSSAATAGSSTR